MAGDIFDEVTLKYEGSEVVMRTYKDGARSLSSDGAAGSILFICTHIK